MGIILAIISQGSQEQWMIQHIKRIEHYGHLVLAKGFYRHRTEEEYADQRQETAPWGCQAGWQQSQAKPIFDKSDPFPETLTHASSMPDTVLRASQIKLT